MKAGVRGDLVQTDKMKSESESVQDGSETCCGAWLGDGGTSKMAEG